MQVKLIATTQSRIIHETTQQPLTPDELLVYIARVSNPSNQLNTATGPRLLAYCIEHGHWSVFEHAHATVEIETSLAIAMQILRHRSFTFQMFSQRYAEVNKLGDLFEPVTLRMKAVGGNRQGSGEDASEKLQLTQANTREYLADNYNALLRSGVAPESARFVLPQCTKTRLYMTGNVRSWIHYLQQRTDSHAQKEHREVAQEIQKILRGVFPTVFDAVTALEDSRRKKAREDQLICEALAFQFGYHREPNGQWYNYKGEPISPEELRELVLNTIR